MPMGTECLAQPPDMDIMAFHTRPGMENGTSNRQNRCQPLK